jgi:hypothetical protein
VPRNCSSAGAKSLVDIPCRYSNGNTSATRGDLRPFPHVSPTFWPVFLRAEEQKGLPMPEP